VKGIKAQAFNVRESFKPDSLTRESQQIYLVDNSLNGRDFVLKRYNIKNDTTLLRANEDFIAPVTKDKIVYRQVDQDSDVPETTAATSASTKQLYWYKEI